MADKDEFKFDDDSFPETDLSSAFADGEQAAPEGMNMPDYPMTIKKSGGSKLRLLLLILLLVALGGGGAYYYFVMSEPPPPPVVARPKPKPAPVPAPAPAAPAGQQGQVAVPPPPAPGTPAAVPVPAPATAPGSVAVAPPKPGTPAPVPAPPAPAPAAAPGKPAVAVAPPPAKPGTPVAAPVPVPATAPVTAPAKPAVAVATPAAKPVPATTPAPAPPAKPVETKAAPAASGGPWLVEAGTYLNPDDLKTAKATIAKLGYPTRVSTTKKTVRLTRLRLGSYGEGEVKQALANARSIAPDAFTLRIGGLYNLYAGTFADPQNIREVAQRLTGAGLQVEEEPVEVKRTISLLRFGGFASQAAAERAAEKARREGIAAEVVKPR